MGHRLKKALEGNDSDAIKTSTDALMTASQAFSQKLYEAAAKDHKLQADEQAAGDAIYWPIFNLDHKNPVVLHLARSKSKGMLRWSMKLVRLDLDVWL